ncbi:hypothetical protein GQ53DRAFT_839555 [Thozetella sp. PMI_491]|nr:hypothetical protein GQ53DRAFT_839555 [Thozetella sp. PMI_491]
MSDQVGTDSAAEARALGNNFYRAGKLPEAEKAYKTAASLAPHDPAPISNLSAVRYEMGDYKGAIAHIREAISLTAPEDKESTKADKLYGRLAKCFLYLLDFASAEEVISSIGDSPLRAELDESIQSTKALWSEIPDESGLRNQVLDRIPRYKSWLQDIPEYYCVGHDAIEDLGEPLGLQDTVPSEISFLFAGSGDGRNLFSTITCMLVREVDRDVRTFSKMHATILDLKPAALARVLIIFNMMAQFDVELREGSPTATDCFLDMAYLFSCQIIPPFVEARLQSNIKELITKLEGDGPVLPFVYVRKQDRSALTRVLRQWQQPWDGISKGADVRELVKGKIMENGFRTAMNFGQIPAHGSQSENEEFDKFTVLFPPVRTARRREPSIVELLTKYRSSKKVKKLLQYIDENWKVNNTLIDYDFANRSREQGHKDSHPLEFHPLEVVESMGLVERRRGGRTTSIEELANLFRTFAASTMTLVDQSRLTVEAIVGEMADTMDRIRYNLLDYRLSPPSNGQGLDPTTFPQTYDYIHMSNIPDYIGGHLTAFFAGRPLLKEDRPSSLRFNNLLNPPEFEGHKAFQSEYLLMYDMQRIRQHFLLTRRPGEVTKDDLPAMYAGTLTNPFVFEGYMIWDREPRSIMSFQQLLSKSDFEKWIYSHLLKICLPYPRPIFSGQPVYAPLNLTALIYLAIGMFDVGYPAHWLIRIFSCICTGVIVTNARPPTKRVSSPADVDAKHPAKEFNVQPWVAEFTTLLSIWRRLLPFGLDSLGDALVPLETIKEYSITFPPFPAEHERLPHFMLLFCNYEALHPIQTSDSIRSLLLEGRRRDNRASARDIREKEIVCVTAFTYTTASRKAVLWMRADAMEKMIAEKWKAFIWRTDAWTPITKSVDMGSGVLTGPQWTA